MILSNFITGDAKQAQTRRQIASPRLVVFIEMPFAPNIGD